MYRVDPYDKSIVIDGWENGIADSPYDGIADMRNVNIISVPGEASVNFSTSITSRPSRSGNVTNSSAANNTLTLDISVYAGQVLTFTGASLPTGMSAGTPYMILPVGGSPSSTVNLCSNFANYNSSTVVDITSDSGTGTFVSTDMDKPTHRYYDKWSGYYYIIDANGRAWINSPEWTWLMNTTLTNASGNGIIAYRGYLFVFRNNAIDYIPTTDAGTWTYGWQTMNTAAGVDNTHYAHLGIGDDTVYYCDGLFLGSFFQKAGQTFDPSNAATYTFNLNAVSIPSNDISNCLAELGTKLMIGGQRNAIYAWDRISTLANYPILLSENLVHRMVTVNTNTYALVGNRGRIYITNGSQAILYKKVPDHISTKVEPTFYWGDLAFLKNQLYFGIKAKTNALLPLDYYGGVWAIDLDTKAIRLVNKLSYDTYSGLASVIIPIQTASGGVTSVLQTGSGTGLYIGWDSGNDYDISSTYGVDNTAGTPYTGSQATIDTDLIPIGTFQKPRQFERIEYKLTKPLTTNERISIKYRLDFSQSYTTIFTDNTVGNYSGTFPINFGNAQWVQFQIVLNSYVAASSGVRLKEIRLLGLKE